MKKSYSATFKAQVVLELLKEEKTPAQISAEHGVHPNVLREWKLLALKSLPALFERRDDLAAKQLAHAQQLEQLYAEIGRLTTQVNWLKKATVLSHAQRRVLLDRDDAELPITTQASLLSISRASYYYRPAPPSAREVAIKHRIDAIYTDCPFYGSRKIQVLLEPEFGSIARNTVRRYMQEMGIAAIYPGPNLSKRHAEHQIYPYLLRGVSAAYPNHVWGIDITYVRLRNSWMYLVAVLDWFARYVVSWALSDSLELPFVVEAVESALALATPLIWNSDQGSHFTSPQYTQRLVAAGVRIDMDGRGRALDNIFTERFWRSLKYEEIYLYDYESPRAARHGITRYMTLYNGQRPHQALGYQTPAAIYFAPPPAGRSF